ncbi:MAG: efflux RND transporter periplasmic adaptor subunit [Bacteroidales bacterium]|nr:efflux RND transporter periplasmic adaptor subunit [Bacteroidales bacterium]
MKKHNLVITFALMLVAIVSGCKEKSVRQLPPPSVQVVQVIQQDIPVMEEFVGQTHGLFDISIQARVDGFLEGIHFEEGRRVRKGQLLYSIDPQPFEAKVAVSMGQLAEANTMLVKAESDFIRIKPLAEINAVSQSDLDAAVAQRDAAGAAVDAAEAAVESAKIELGYTKIYSPIDGIIGKTEAYPGDYVGRGLTNVILNEVSRIDTVLVNFHIPEEKYLEIVRPFLAGTDSVRIQRKQTNRGLTMILADGSLYPLEGKIEFINRQVNATTGTILLQASFPNPSLILRPGQFARVRVVIDVISEGLLIPQRCAQELQGIYNVYVVNDQDEVEFREIEVGSTYQTSYLIVTSGLGPGDKIIYEGLQKVKSGIKVNPVLKDISTSESEN